MAEPAVLLYSADLRELTSVIGAGRRADFDLIWEEVEGSDEEEGWEPAALPLLRELLERLVFQGKAYEGLAEERRYLLTQLVVDMFDLFVDSDPEEDCLSAEVPLSHWQGVVDGMPPNSPGRRMGSWLIRGREIVGDGLLWRSGRPEDFCPYLGFVRASELPEFLGALSAPTPAAPRVARLRGKLRQAVQLCLERECDLVSLVG